MIEKLETLGKKLTQTEETANLDLSGWDPRTRMGVETAKKQAQEAVEKLRAEYQQEAKKFVVKVFLDGDLAKVEQFLAATENDVISVRGDGLYRKLAEGVERTVDHRTRQFGVTQFARLVDELADIAKNNGVRELPMPKMDGNLLSTTADTPEAIVAIIRAAVRSTSKDDLNSYLIEREALAKITAARAAAPVIPVVVTGLTKDEIQGIGEGLFRSQANLYVNIDDVDAKKDLVAGVRAKITKSWRAIKGS